MNLYFYGTRQQGNYSTLQRPLFIWRKQDKWKALDFMLRWFIFSSWQNSYPFDHRLRSR